MRDLLACSRQRSLWLLAALVGFTWALEQMFTFGLGHQLSIAYVLVSALILCLPLGYLIFYVTAFFLYWTGKILKGKGSFEGVLQAFAYSKVPEIFILISWFVIIGLMGRSAFTETLVSTSYSVAVTILLFVQVVLFAWEFVLLLHTLGEVQEFSAWMSIWNVFFTWIALFIIYQVCLMLAAHVMQPQAA